MAGVSEIKHPVLRKLSSDITVCVASLKKDYNENSDPINDDNQSLHRFCVKLESALDNGRKSRGLFGSQKCYWNYFCQCLVPGKIVHDGIKFVKLSAELKTSYGKGRAFVRYCLMHHCLADSLQQCFTNQKVTREWYDSNSIPSQMTLWSPLINSIYDLNEIQFDLSPHLHDLDDGWPVFARKLFPSVYSWKPPSRSVSLSSLNSTTSYGLENTSTSILEDGDEDKQQLQDQVEQLTIEVKSLKGHESELECEVKVLSHKLQGMSDSNCELEKANKDLIGKDKFWADKQLKLCDVVAAAEKQASEYCAKYKRLEKQLESNSSKETKLNATIGELQNANKNQEIEMKLMEKELNVFRTAKYPDQISELDRQISDLQGLYKKEVCMVDELLSRKESLLEDRRAKDVLVETLKEENAGLEKVRETNMELRGLVEELESNKMEIVAQLESLEVETSSLQNELSTKEEEVLDIEKQNAKLEERLQADNGRGDLVEVLSRGCSMCDMSKARSLSLADQVDNLKKQKTSVDLQKLNLNQKFDLLTKEYEESLRDIANKDKLLFKNEVEIGKVKKSLNGVDVILRKQEEMIDSLEKKLKVSFEHNVKLNNEVSRLQDIEDNNDVISVSSAPEIRVYIPSREEMDAAKVESEAAEDAKEDDRTVLDEVDANSVQEPLVITTASRTLTRLKSLVEDGEEIHNIVESAKEVKSKVHQQEEKLKKQREVIERCESKFTHLKSEHEKLKTSEAILRYELKEKRKMLEKLRKQLTSSRDTYVNARQKQNSAQIDWNNLREEFSSRSKRQSEESGFMSDEAKAPENPADSAITSQASSTSEIGNAPPSDDTFISSRPEEMEASPTNSEDAACSSSLESKPRSGGSRLQFLEEQCQFLYLRLVQSSKKSNYLESKLNKLLGLNSDGSDTEDNVESIAEYEDIDGEKAIDEEKPDLEIVCEEGLAKSSSVDGDQPLEVVEINEEIVQPSVEEGSGDVGDDCVLVEGDEEETITEDEAEVDPVVDSGEPVKLDVEVMVEEEERIQTSNDEYDGKDEQEVIDVHVELSVEELIALLEKVTSERDELRKKEKDMKKRVDFMLRKEREESKKVFVKFESEKHNLYNTITQLKRTIDEVTKSKSEFQERLLETEKTNTESEKKLTSTILQLGTELATSQRALKGYAQQEQILTVMRCQMYEQEILITYLERAMTNIMHERKVEHAHDIELLKKAEAALSTRDEECQTLTDQLKSTTLKFDEECKKTADLKEKLEKIERESHVFITELKSELDQLHDDNQQLMENLIKLLKEKDRLWQKTDRLTDIQKNAMSGKWMDDSQAQNCINCRSFFSFFNRKHHCRICGQIFCGSCCNNWITIAASRGKSRVCDVCMINQSLAEMEVSSYFPDINEENEIDVDSMINEESDKNSSDKSESIPIPGYPSNICEDETDNTKSEKITPRKTMLKSISADAGASTSFDRLYQPLTKFARSRSSSAPPEYEFIKMKTNIRKPPCAPKMEEFCIIGDEEISKSLSTSSPYTPMNQNSNTDSIHTASTRTIDDIINAANETEFTTIWINAGGCYSIPVFIDEPEISFQWQFTTENKGIVFSVEYQEVDKDAEDVISRTLLKATKCDSHLRPVFGKLAVKRKGIYTLVFNNSFSMVLAKKLMYKLRINR